MDPLESWVSLNLSIMNMDEKQCLALLAKEKNGKKRKQFLYRIHSRLNRLRADRERDEILATVSSR